MVGEQSTSPLVSSLFPPSQHYSGVWWFLCSHHKMVQSRNKPQLCSVSGSDMDEASPQFCQKSPCTQILYPFPADPPAPPELTDLFRSCLTHPRHPGREITLPGCNLSWIGRGCLLATSKNSSAEPQQYYRQYSVLF